MWVGNRDGGELMWCIYGKVWVCAMCLLIYVGGVGIFHARHMDVVGEARPHIYGTRTPKAGGHQH